MLFYQITRRFVRFVLLQIAFIQPCLIVYAQTSTIANNGWANNSVNTVVFRKNALVTFRNHQYAAFYDAGQYVVLAKRKKGTLAWQTLKTDFKGDATDAHKCICIMIDGDGYLHLAWGMHNQSLNYSRSVRPGSLLLTGQLQMTKSNETSITYPEFYKLPGGDILFFYRDGGSGNGNLVLNRYNLKSKTWRRIQANLIDGEGQRNAYWQVAIDAKGVLYLSWVWRETPDVASNHDLCYACSKDGGLTWEKSSGEKYILPINAVNAEYACKIPQKSELINQTSMFADDNGHPYIATYWLNGGSAVPQYHIVYNRDGKWHTVDLAFRETPFRLGGAGTKSIPISRPQIVAWKEKDALAAALIFRDTERDNKVSIAVNRNLDNGNWILSDLTATSVGSWEPAYDTELWKNEKILDLFVQKNTQADGEGSADTCPQPVQVVEWKPL